MNKSVKVLDLILKYVVVALLLGMVFTIFAQVVTRYVFKMPLTWSEEIARYMFIWLIFLGSAIAVGKKSHIIIDIAITHIPEKFATYTNMLVNVLIVIYIVVITYSGFLVLPVVTSSFSSALQISYVYIYAAVPVSGLISLVYLWDGLLFDMKKLRKR